MTYFNVFLRILRLGEKYAYFTVFYNGFERTEQLWLQPPDVCLMPLNFAAVLSLTGSISARQMHIGGLVLG